MLKLYNPLFVLATFCMVLFSCNIVSFELLDTSVSVNEKAAYYEAENIEVSFSSSMNTESAERLVILKKDNVVQETEISWNGARCLVKPVGGFCLGQEYTFSLCGEVLTSDGRTYNVNITRKFIFGNKENIFLVENSVAPTDKNSALEFYFNKELDIASFEQEFKISPYIEVKKEYAADKKSVCIIPADKWLNNTFYTWTLENVLSADKYRMYKTYSDNFMAVNENERPKIISICPVNLDETLNPKTAAFLTTQDLSALFGKQPLGIVFDKPMDFESVKNALYFEPSVGGVLLQSDEYKFVYMPYENYQIGKEYLLKVNHSAKDIYGLEMSEQKNFYFTTSDEFLKINSIDVDGIELHKDETITVEATNDGTLFVKIYFSCDIVSENSSNIQKAINLNMHFPNTINPAKLTHININGNCVSTKWENLSKQTEYADCIYELKIAGGKNYITTKNQTYLEADECFFIRIK